LLLKISAELLLRIEFVSDPPPGVPAVHRLMHFSTQHPRLCNQPLGEPQGLRALIIALSP
jgi:hypothetical protein